MDIHRGDIYWAQLDEANANEIVHPQVVIQDDAINNSRIDTTVVCGLSTNMKKAYGAGNVILEMGEANLQRKSVVVVSQVSCVAKNHLGVYIGTLGPERVEEILQGMRQLAKLGPGQGRKDRG